MSPASSPGKYRVALIQLHPLLLRPVDNFSTASTYIRDAASEGVSLAILPEYHLTSWRPDHPSFIEVCRSSANYLSEYRKLAAELNICIVPGTIVEVHFDEHKKCEILHNVAYFINHDGTILHRYVKTNLWHPERPHLTSAPSHSRHTAFDTPIGRVGLLICWDLAFPEAFRELIADSAKTIIIPTFWTLADCSDYGLRQNPRSEALFVETMCTARAFENTCAVIFVNAGAQAKTMIKARATIATEEGAADAQPTEEDDDDIENNFYAGMSRVCLPFVGALGDATKTTAREGMSVVDVHMEHVEEAEKNYKVREDMASEGWHYAYRHTTH